MLASQLGSLGAWAWTCALSHTFPGALPRQGRPVRVKHDA